MKRIWRSYEKLQGFLIYKKNAKFVALGENV